jgi:hypothetical protein
MGEAHLWKTLWKLKPQGPLFSTPLRNWIRMAELISDRNVLKKSYLFLFVAG